VIGVFELVVLIVLITTIGKVLAVRSARPQLAASRHEPEVILQLNDAMSDLNARLEKLEEERDFYRALLESPKRGDLSAPGEAGPTSPPASTPDPGSRS
jgi:hypothetical protein